MSDIVSTGVVANVDHPPAAFDQDVTSLLNLSNTSFAEGNPRVSISFTAPTSGRVILTVGGALRDSNSGTNRVYLAAEVTVGDEDGEVVLAANITTSGVSSTPGHSQYEYRSRTVLLEGLTAGQRYFARVLHAVEGGATCDVGVRDILAEPTT